ncbi:hypothetical protein [Pseudorhodoferax sp. Leaf274]|uniref:hypothetical protein n=1 Tax=Pseudorhodoferax sp. Leaf274 TaxID=1736318 RepID=UPI000702B709|nr:hypothetical protein [Pseudorhodoferax sp. Leaf274]KQP35263.1 hypothetical protein ASF44_18060 [Pseudorhodoferax sp. Leaf274]
MSSAALHALEAAPAARPAPDDAASLAEEAARYAVLRRMGSAIRHQIAGSLQPVSMVASLLERRVQAPAPNMDALRRNCSEMNTLARSASSECVALMGWLAPHEGEQVALGAGVADCLHLLTTELSFRGFTVLDTTQAVHARVARLGLRTLVPACLMALTDAAAAPSQVRIEANAEGAVAHLSMVLVPAPDAEGAAQRAKAYRPLTWSDVTALAQAEGVDLQLGPQTVRMQFDVQPATDDKDVRWG